MHLLNVRILKTSVSVVTFLYVWAWAQTAPIDLTLQAEHFSSKQGGTFEPPEDKVPRTYVENLQNGDWIRFDSVNFLDECFDSITVYYTSSWPQDISGAGIRVRIDSPTGTVIASLSNLPSSPGYGTSIPEAAALAATSGVHALVLTFEGGSGNLLDLDRVRLSGGITVDPTDAKTYYVSTEGDDTNDGLSVDNPFRTIQKAASLMRPGATCLIREGIYRETVRPLFTGCAGAPLTFQAYGSENVVISGADPVTGWSVHQGEIYKAPMDWTLGKYKDQVIVNGKMAWAARGPNVDDDYQPHPYLNWCGTGCYNWKKWHDEIEPVAAPSRICLGHTELWSGDVPDGAPFTMTVDQNDDLNYALPSNLFGRPNDFFKGGLITMHNYYYTGVGIITSSTSTSDQSRITASKTNSCWRNSNGPGWVSHVFGLLDAPNEWHLDSASQQLYLWAPGGGNPSSRLVEAKARTLAFDLRGKHYVNLTGLRVIAASVTMGEASNCVIDRCHFRYVSHYDTYDWYDVASGFWNGPWDPSTGYTGIFVGGHDNIVQNSSIIGSAGSGVVFEGRHNTVTNCRIHSCAYMGTYQSGVTFMQRDITDPRACLGNKVTHSTIKGCPRADIQISQAALPLSSEDTTRIQYNDLSLAAYGSAETGSIGGQGCGQVVVSHNWLHGVAGPESGHLAIEDDFGAKDWVVHHNVFWQGDALVEGGFLVGFHWFLTYEETGYKVFNNTVASKCFDLHADIDKGWPSFVEAGGLENGAFNNIYAEGDTAQWLFTNVDDNDYTLREGSPAIDAGSVLPGMEVPFTGASPDLGAYEYGEPRWRAGADWEEQPWIYPPTGSSARGLGRAGAHGHPGNQRLRVLPGKLVVEGIGGRPALVSLFDVSGATVAVQRTRGSTAVVNTGSLAPGMYVVRLSNNTGRVVWTTLLR